MTVETEVANLTTAVDNLASAVNVKKATLDASVADAESARDASQAARDTANTHKLAAEAAATSATNTAASLTGFDLDAIAATKAVTAVDVFVYDTSKDSDGGAWRKRTQHTSWYNETLNTATRGARREFPAVAVIVAEADKVTIYDGDDPALPMWMVLQSATAAGTPRNLWRNNRPATTTQMLNGKLSVGLYDTGEAGGVVFLNFTSDIANRIETVGYLSSLPISRRNSGEELQRAVAPGGLIATTVNDVAMTVLPDAPIDPATGLPVPTIAVATAGGVSVITDSGAVYDSAATNIPTKVAFNPLGLWYDETSSTRLYFATYADIQAGDGFGDQFANSSVGAQEFDLIARPDGDLVASEEEVYAGCLNAFGGSVRGLMQHLPNYIDQTKGMSALLTSTYNTGWMNGDIKGAFLADTDDTDLVGSGELVTNGTFDTDTSGWSATANTTLSVVSNALRIEATANGSAYASQNLTGLIVGRQYALSFSVVSETQSTGNPFYGSVGSNIAITIPSGTINTYFTPSTTNVNLRFGVGDAALSGEYLEIDNISVKLADADRSVNNNGLIVNGTVTRSPVATGADLVAYSGFSASNYLEQPYNPDLDFGTGDFCISFWSKLTAASGNAQAVFSTTKYAGGGLDASGVYIRFAATTGYLGVAVSDDDFATLDLVQVSTANFNSWDFYTAVRSGSNLSIYRNGALAASGTITNAIGSLTSSEPLTIGTLTGTFAELTNGSLALLRISATAPTAEQIRRIYEDEKVLFQEGAQATLYGSSDAVTALAHDPVTDLLHVGTSAGRSVFQGLRRVSNTTTAVGTAISASNGLVVEE